MPSPDENPPVLHIPGRNNPSFSLLFSVFEHLRTVHILTFLTETSPLGGQGPGLVTNSETVIFPGSDLSSRNVRQGNGGGTQGASRRKQGTFCSKRTEEERKMEQKHNILLFPEVLRTPHRTASFCLFCSKVSETGEVCRDSTLTNSETGLPTMGGIYQGDLSGPRNRVYTPGKPLGTLGTGVYTPGYPSRVHERHIHQGIPPGYTRGMRRILPTRVW